MKITGKWVVDRIDELRTESHISEYRLCELAGIKTSTMSAMRRRGSLPKLQTLILICEALDITLSEFFKTASEPTDAGYLTNVEIELVSFARRLPADSVKHLLAYAKGLCDALRGNDTKE